MARSTVRSTAKYGTSTASRVRPPAARVSSATASSKAQARRCRRACAVASSGSDGSPTLCRAASRAIGCIPGPWCTGRTRRRRYNAALGAGWVMIDADVHNEVPAATALFPYLPEYWIEHITNTLFKGPTDTYYPPESPVATRPGSKPDGAPAGSSLDLLKAQVLDATPTEYAVLNCLYAIDSLHNPDAAVALAAPVNDWQIAEWLDKEPRLRASIVVPSQLPALAA